MGKVVIIGQGYVGLPLAQGAIRANYSTVGLDLNEKVIEKLSLGTSHVDDISDCEIADMLRNGYRPTSDPQVISSAEIVIICVPTPLRDGGGPDLAAVEASARAIGQYLSPGTLVILESTTYPGTTENLVRPLLEECGHVLDKDFYLAFSPERIDPGNKTYNLKNTPKIVGGVTAASTALAVDFYSNIVETVVPVKSAKEAETAKLLENTYRHINIALVNEMAKFCHELDIDLWEVIRAAKTKPFGFHAFYPGPGVGGHCIPIDPNYLSYEVERRLGYPFRFVELAQEINNSMPGYIVSRIADVLNDRCLPLRGSKILLLGVTYKPDISDQRESPAVVVDQLLREKGAVLSYHDPYVETWVRGERADVRVDDVAEAVKNSDIVVLLQNHSEYPLDELADVAPAFFDTRGATSRSSIML